MRSEISIAALAAMLATPVIAAPPRIVVDTPVTASLVADVLGDLGTPDVLIDQGSSVHHYQMRPSEAAALQSADLLVWFGPELTPWLSRAAATRGDKAGLELLDVPGTVLRDYADVTHDDDTAQDDHDHSDGHEHEHDEDHGHDDEHEHADHDHHDGVDPHAWLDPGNAAPWLNAIAEHLSGLDPDNAAAYAANATEAATRIARLDDDLGAMLAPFVNDSFVVFHDAYGYFTDHFGLSPAIAVSLGDATSPSAARLAEVRAQVVQSGARCAFPEFAHDAKLIDTVIEGSTVTLGQPLDPSGAAIEPGPRLYADLLTGLAASLSDCLSRR